MIKEYISELCDILEISEPAISYDTSDFSTKTTMAQYAPYEDIIYIRKKEKPDPDYMFAIAHEVRHAWQFKTNETFYFKDYKSSDQIENLEKYNMQIAEVDANAFAGIVMTDFFSLAPQWHGFTEKNIEAIKARIEYLITTELK